ncbi:MAG: oxygenase MpaB family protein [Cyanobacteria bacterium J06626_18]
MNRALELAVLRTFCVPRISSLLKQTGEFVHRSQKRYDDTGLILGNIMKWGYDSPQGQAAIATMNRIHRRHSIYNEDFLYVLSVLIYEPVRWNTRYGWRPFTGLEKQALFEFWHAVGQRMGISDIPPSYEAFEQFNQAYESQYFCYSPDNQMIGNAVVALMQSWLPKTAAPMVPTVVRALVDDRLRKALGWSQPPASVCWTLKHLLQWSRRGARWLPQRRHANFLVDTPNTTYPTGYDLATLGPQEAPPQSGASRCPFMRMQSFFKARA